MARQTQQSSLRAKRSKQEGRWYSVLAFVPRREQPKPLGRRAAYADRDDVLILIKTITAQWPDGSRINPNHLYYNLFYAAIMPHTDQDELFSYHIS